MISVGERVEILRGPHKGKRGVVVDAHTFGSSARYLSGRYLSIRLDGKDLRAVFIKDIYVESI